MIHKFNIGDVVKIHTNDYDGVEYNNSICKIVSIDESLSENALIKYTVTYLSSKFKNDDRVLTLYGRNEMIKLSEKEALAWSI